jgi:hypothetical protein
MFSSLKISCLNWAVSSTGCFYEHSWKISRFMGEHELNRFLCSNSWVFSFNGVSKISLLKLVGVCPHSPLESNFLWDVLTIFLVESSTTKAVCWIFLSGWCAGYSGLLFWVFDSSIGFWKSEGYSFSAVRLESISVDLLLIKIFSISFSVFR